MAQGPRDSREGHGGSNGHWVKLQGALKEGTLGREEPNESWSHTIARKRGVMKDVEGRGRGWWE